MIPNGCARWHATRHQSRARWSTPRRPRCRSPGPLPPVSTMNRPPTVPATPPRRPPLARLLGQGRPWHQSGRHSGTGVPVPGGPPQLRRAHRRQDHPVPRHWCRPRTHPICTTLAAKPTRTPGWSTPIATQPPLPGGRNGSSATTRRLSSRPSCETLRRCSITCAAHAARPHATRRSGAAAVLHCVPGLADPYSTVMCLRDELAPGSYLVISHLTADDRQDVAAAAAKHHAARAEPWQPRTHAQTSACFGDWDITPPGPSTRR